MIRPLYNMGPKIEGHDWFNVYESHIHFMVPLIYYGAYNMGPGTLHK